MGFRGGRVLGAVVVLITVCAGLVLTSGCGPMSCRVSPPPSLGVPVKIETPPRDGVVQLTVVDARTERGRLVVDVETNGACTLESIELYADGVFEASDPPRCDVVVVATGTVGCEGVRTDSETFDLGPMVDRLLNERPGSRGLVLRVLPTASEDPITVSTYRLQ